MNISRFMIIAVVCAGIAGCYTPPPPPPPRPPAHTVSVTCKTNMYGERVCVRSVSSY